MKIYQLTANGMSFTPIIIVWMGELHVLECSPSHKLALIYTLVFQVRCSFPGRCLVSWCIFQFPRLDWLSLFSDFSNLGQGPDLLSRPAPPFLHQKLLLFLQSLVEVLFLWNSWLNDPMGGGASALSHNWTSHMPLEYKPA